MWMYWTHPRMKSNNPQTMRLHQSQDSSSANPLAHLLCLTMATHFTTESPSPARAPHRPDTVLVIQRDSKNPIQLNKKEMMNVHKNVQSVPMAILARCSVVESTFLSSSCCESSICCCSASLISSSLVLSASS